MCHRPPQQTRSFSPFPLLTCLRALAERGRDDNRLTIAQYCNLHLRTWPPLSDHRKNLVRRPESLTREVQDQIIDHQPCCLCRRARRYLDDERTDCTRAKGWIDAHKLVV